MVVDGAPGTVVEAPVERPDVSGAVCRITVPTADVVRIFGRRGRVPVSVTFANGFAFRGSLMPRGGSHMLPLSAEVRRSAGVAEGERVRVWLHEDSGQRTVDVAAELLEALDRAGVREAFETLSYSHRLEWANAFTAAKRPETRAKRADECVASMRERVATLGRRRRVREGSTARAR